jgi:hypothetical protein
MLGDRVGKNRRIGFRAIFGTIPVEALAIALRLNIFSMSILTKLSGRTPDYVTELERIYGAPSRTGFGGAVFYEQRDKL